MNPLAGNRSTPPPQAIADLLSVLLAPGCFLWVESCHRGLWCLSPLTQQCPQSSPRRDCCASFLVTPNNIASCGCLISSSVDVHSSYFRVLAVTHSTAAGVRAQAFVFLGVRLLVDLVTLTLRATAGPCSRAAVPLSAGLHRRGFAPSLHILRSLSAP